MRHGENPREILRFWTSMLRLLLRLICNPSWRAWSMSKPKGWTDDGETETHRNDGSDWNLVILIDIPSAWCLKHQLLSSLHHPRICVNFYFFPEVVKTLHQDRSDLNPVIFIWGKMTPLFEMHIFRWKAFLEISNHASWTYRRGAGTLWDLYLDRPQHLWRQPVSWRSWR